MTSKLAQLEMKETCPKGVYYARLAGRLVGLLLIITGIIGLLTNKDLTLFESFKSLFFIIYGLALNAPFHRLSDRMWKRSFIALVIISVAFVFVMIASVMFGYMAAAERGERLGVPGFEGTLIFMSLMQVPAVLFQRRPDLID